MFCFSDMQNWLWCCIHDVISFKTKKVNQTNSLVWDRNRKSASLKSHNPESPPPPKILWICPLHLCANYHLSILLANGNNFLLIIAKVIGSIMLYAHNFHYLGEIIYISNYDLNYFQLHNYVYRFYFYLVTVTYISYAYVLIL